AWELVWRFFQLLSPYRCQIFWILVSLTAATLIGLIPPAGTKFIIDYGLNGRSLPDPLVKVFSSLADPLRLPLATVLTVVAVSRRRRRSTATGVSGRPLARIITQSIGNNWNCNH